jgi:pectate lyase
MESSTNITFTLTETKTLILVFVESTTNIKIDGEKITSDTNIITVTLDAGTHTITKADTKNLFYIVIE